MPDRQEAMQQLARDRYLYEDGIETIHSIKSKDGDKPEDPIRLLQVNTNTTASGIVALRFPPTPASGNFPTIIVEVTPGEYRDIKEEKLKLPVDWVVGEEIPREDRAEGAGNGQP